VNSNTFVQPLIQDVSFSAAAAALWSGQPISVEGIAGGSCALAVAALFRQGNDSMLLITPNGDSAVQIAEDVALFLAEPGETADEPEYRCCGSVLLFPSGVPRGEESETVPAMTGEAFGERVAVLKRLSRTEERFIVTASIPALLQPVPPPERLKERTQTLAVNSRVDLELLRRCLIEGGYHSTSAIDLPGEFAVRGYILDLFAPDWELPVRIEFFNDEIESIRRFDLTTQRSLEKIEEIDLTRLQPGDCAGASLLDYFPPSAPIVLIEPALFSSAERSE